MDILKKYLNKLGVTEFSQLNDEEKDVYRNWEDSLSGKKLTDSDVATFLITLEDAIIDELTDVKISDKRDMFLKMQLDLIRKIKRFLASPEMQKKLTEMSINNLLK